MATNAQVTAFNTRVVAAIARRLRARVVAQHVYTSLVYTTPCNFGPATKTRLRPGTGEHSLAVRRLSFLTQAATCPGASRAELGKLGVVDAAGLLAAQAKGLHRLFTTSCRLPECSQRRLVIGSRVSLTVNLCISDFGLVNGTFGTVLGFCVAPQPHDRLRWQEVRATVRKQLQRRCKREGTEPPGPQEVSVAATEHLIDLARTVGFGKPAAAGNPVVAFELGSGRRFTMVVPDVMLGDVRLRVSVAAGAKASDTWAEYHLKRGHFFTTEAFASPLVMAAALTCHKVQAQTLPGGVLVVLDRMASYGQVYVALSRARQLAPTTDGSGGIQLACEGGRLPVWNIRAHPFASSFDRRLARLTSEARHSGKPEAVATEDVIRPLTTTGAASYGSRNGSSSSSLLPSRPSLSSLSSADTASQRAAKRKARGAPAAPAAPAAVLPVAGSRGAATRRAQAQVATAAVRSLVRSVYRARVMSPKHKKQRVSGIMRRLNKRG